MITSFRIRLALLSALLAGMALAAFGVTTWWQIRQMKLLRIDSDVRTHAEREANRRRDQAGWQRTEENIISEIGVRDREDFLLLVEDADQNLLYRSANWPNGLRASYLPWPKQIEVRRPNPPTMPGPRGDSSQPPPPPGPPARSNALLEIGGQRWRLGLATSDTARIVVAVSESSIDAEMKGIRNALIVAMPLTLVLIGVGAWLFSGRSLRPVHKLMASARRVTAEGLDQRIPVNGEDREFVELIEVYNEMLERLERSFTQARRFSADAAHELKTPLAILQGQLERAIQSAEDGSAMQSELTSILDEVRRLSTISRKLLLLSQADAGKLKIHFEPLDLSKAVGELVEDARMLAPDLDVRANIESGLEVKADWSLLEQILHNLVSNAIKYNVAGGWITIEVHGKSTLNLIEVTVANSTRPIGEDEIRKVFDRFYRAQSAYDNNIEGIGLGLSVSRELARAHGGDISLTASSNGTIVNATLVVPTVEKKKAATSSD